MVFSEKRGEVRRSKKKELELEQNPFQLGVRKNIGADLPAPLAFLATGQIFLMKVTL